MGQTVFDNAAPAQSEFGVCTGRNIAGAQNGSMTLNDLLDIYAYLWMRGFMPDTLIGSFNDFTVNFNNNIMNLLPTCEFLPFVLR